MSGKRGIRRVAVGAVVAAAVAATPAQAMVDEDGRVVRSFDDTPIVWRLMLPDDASADRPVPVVIVSVGYGDGRAAFPPQVPMVRMLLQRGFAVATYDARGFGQSGGEAQMASYEHEARDIEALVDALSGDARVAHETPGDPRVGLFGGSYGGASTLAAAARDGDVDAAVAAVTWHDLLESLAPAGVPKPGWVAGLGGYGYGKAAAEGLAGGPAGTQTGSVNPLLARGIAEAAGTGAFSTEVRDFLRSRGARDVIGKVAAPTYLVHATTDPIFPPSQAAANYRALRAASPELPLKMRWVCDRAGHGVCAPWRESSTGSDPSIVDWFDRHVAGADLDTGPAFEYVTQDGAEHASSEFPVAPGTPLVGSSAGGAVTVGAGDPAFGNGPESAASASVAPRPVQQALEVPVPDGTGVIIGAPRVSFRAEALATGASDVPLFFQLVDRRRNAVVGNQVTAHVVSTGSGTYDVELEHVAYALSGADELVLQVFGASANHSPYRGVARIELSDIRIELPRRSEGGQ